MSPDLLEHAAAAFALGSVQGASPVTGGLSNELWRVETSTGTYLVKVMRVNADRPEFESNIEAAYGIESMAYAHGVPCPEPVPARPGKCLARIDGQWLRVHRWVNGVPPGPGEYAEEAGRLLARIHSSAATDLAPLEDEPWDEEGWASLADAAGMAPDLAPTLRGAAQLLAELEADTTAAPGMVVPQVPSHGDLDQKNTLVVNQTLMAVDWDAARTCSVAREAVGLALDWSDDVAGFQRVLAGYGSAIPTEPWVFGGWVSALGGWLVYNATHRASTDLGESEIRATLSRLLAFHAERHEYVAALTHVRLT